MSFNMASSYDAIHKWHRPAQGLLTIFSWWEKVKNRWEDGPKKSGSGRAGGHLHSRRLLQIAIGLVLTPVMIGCLCRGRVGLGVLTETSGKYRLGMSHSFKCHSRPLREPLLPTLLIVLRGVLVFGVVEVIRLLSTSQWSRVFLAGVSCCTLREGKKNIF